MVAFFPLKGGCMLLVPQIYLKNGESAYPEGTTNPLFTKDPMATAKSLKDFGADGIYCVDLSTSPVGTNPNLKIIKRITDEYKLAVYSFGGFKTAEEIESQFHAGASLVTLGAIAYQKPDFLEEISRRFAGRIATRIDVKGGKVVIPGYAVAPNKTAMDYALNFHKAGVRYIIYSDVSADGTMHEENFKSLAQFCENVNLRVVCAGEISSLSDIEKISRLNLPRLDALILGKSIYENKVDFRAARALQSDMEMADGDSTMTQM